MFQIDAAEVGREVPAYAQFVSREISRLGRLHLLVHTQFFSEEIDRQCGRFTEVRNERFGTAESTVTPAEDILGGF